MFVEKVDIVEGELVVDLIIIVGVVLDIGMYFVCIVEVVCVFFECFFVLDFVVDLLFVGMFCGYVGVVGLLFLVVVVY